MLPLLVCLWREFSDLFVAGSSRRRGTPVLTPSLALLEEAFLRQGKKRCPPPPPHSGRIGKGLDLP